MVHCSDKKKSAEALPGNTVCAPKDSLEDSLIVIGNFDGVHCGHQWLLAEAARLAEARQLLLKVVSFNPHPRIYFQRMNPFDLLTTIKEKKLLLESYGVKEVIDVPFDQTIASLTCEEFFRNWLVQKYKAKALCLGEYFCFGSDRICQKEPLREICDRLDMELFTVKSMITKEVVVSSTRIRQALLDRNLPLVTQLLGRSFSVSGRVVCGKQLGRKLGFPTANLELPTKMMPPSGVYWVDVIVQGEDLSIPALANVGFRPTVSAGDGKNLTIEVHIPSQQLDLYDKMITVKFLQSHRFERTFDSLDALKNQIAIDVATHALWLKQSKIQST